MAFESELIGAVDLAGEESRAPVGVLPAPGAGAYGRDCELPSAVELVAELAHAGSDLEVEIVEEGLRDDTVPSLARLDRASQVGRLPQLISQLAGVVADSAGAYLVRGSTLAALVGDHAREREALGFGPRKVVTELQLLRRALGGFLSQSTLLPAAEDVLLVERRLNEAVDSLVGDCVAAYFDEVTADLAYRARRDPLTDLLNHQSFSEELQLELERARRYEHGVSLVFVDLDRFKQINDTLGHREGDRVLRTFATLLRKSVRGSDVAGRMGGDEFAVVLLEAEQEAGEHLVARLDGAVCTLIGRGRLPALFALSAGIAHYPSEGEDADALFMLADARLYAAKRSKNA